jgi:Zn-dependent protease with chaperone function
MQRAHPEVSSDVWGRDVPAFPAGRKLALLAPGVLLALAFGAIAGLFTTLAIGVACLAIVFAITSAFVARSGRWAVRRARAGHTPSPRITNLAEGIAASCGLPAPRVHVIDRGGPNAFAVSSGGRPALVVTRSLMQDFTRTEIEAVVAHCLARVANGQARYSAIAALWGAWAVGLAPTVGPDADVRAASITRYPPALVSTISKADPRVDDRLGPLWFVWDGESHVPSEQREEALSQL